MAELDNEGALGNGGRLESGVHRRGGHCVDCGDSVSVGLSVSQKIGDGRASEETRMDAERHVLVPRYPGLPSANRSRRKADLLFKRPHPRWLYFLGIGR